MIRIRFGRKWLALVPVAVLMSYAGIWKTNGWVAIYPSPIKLPCIALFAYVNAVYTGPRAEVDMQPSTAASRPKYLIYLVDESVRGDFLGINGCPIDTTPKLNRYPHLVNFGIASSASNFSAGTNIILQSGTQLHELPDKDQVTLKRPNLFQFAKAAGYKTYYLDGQGTGRRRHNFMTKHDFNHIDVAYQAFDHNPSGAHFENDFLMLRLVLDVLKEDEPAFIYVNKYGAHTCYDDCYPPTKTIFHPASDDRAARELAADRLVNSYGNALRWSVDDFFAQLLPALNLENTIVVYTSDHGESLGEGGVRLSHATADNPPAVQANVPMVLFGSGAKRRFPDGVKHLKDNRSHFHLFPTLLTFMGYEEQEVTKRYGAPLWSRQAPARRFLSGDLFARTPSTINEFK
jgi:glucan phosphoethanolaminetransferase (alkaline phosphatase superfamily)